MKKIKNLISLLIFSLIFTYVVIYGSLKRKDLGKNGIYSIGKITGLKNSKSGMMVHYSFEVENKIVYDSGVKGEFTYVGTKKLLQKTFPVIYLKSNPNESRLLIFKDDFDRLNLPFPDSLKYVEDILKECRESR